MKIKVQVWEEVTDANIDLNYYLMYRFEQSPDGRPRLYKVTTV